MRVEDMQRFKVDTLFQLWENPLTIECDRCRWIIEVDPPRALAELVQRADEHTEVCR